MKSTLEALALSLSPEDSLGFRLHYDKKQLLCTRLDCSPENPLLGGECSFEKAARFSLRGWVLLLWDDPPLHPLKV